MQRVWERERLGDEEEADARCAHTLRVCVCVCARARVPRMRARMENTHIDRCGPHLFVTKPNLSVEGVGGREEASLALAHRVKLE